MSNPRRVGSHSFTLTLTLTLALALCGCGAAVSPGDASVSDGPTPIDGASPVRCGVAPESFPAFDRACGRRDDCALAVHQTDCCGNTVALGITNAELPRFAAAELQCVAQYPGCGCPSMGTLADDGQRAFDRARLAVDCVAGRCTTSVRP